MQSGILRHRISIQNKIISFDSDGGIIEDFVDVFGFKLSAEIKYDTGRELLSADAIQSRVNAKIRIRYRKGVEPTMRIIHNDTIFNIEAIMPDPKYGNDYLLLKVYTGLNEG